MIKSIKRVIWYLLISSFLYVVVLLFVFPPLTITQLTNVFGLGLKRDYVAWEDLSYNIKLAAIASEDQAFPDHIGIDWEAMERSFKPKKKKTPENKSKPETTIDEIDLSYVHIIIDNQLGNKLFDFDVHSLKSKVDYDGDNWNTNLFIETKINSLAFNTVHGSFAKEKMLEGNFDISYSEAKQKIDINTKKLKIGSDSFDIVAFFNIGKNNSLFGINIGTDILWRNASNLLSGNISKKLNQFDLKKPIKVNCDIKEILFISFATSI